MSKVIAIGDIHGRDAWIEIVKRESDADKIVFIGDYFDSFDIPFESQLANFLALIEYKRSFPDKIVLLLGNHDYHYLLGVQDRYSGFQEGEKGFRITGALEKALKEGLIQMAFSSGKFMFTHAGVTDLWSFSFDCQGANAADKINKLFKDDRDAFRFVGPDPYGDSIQSSPIWVRPNSLSKGGLTGKVNVVGHTQVEHVYISGILPIILIDALASGEYLEILDETPRVKTLVSQ
jgi:predicted phosphodiesterase